MPRTEPDFEHALNTQQIRLSDRILCALELALEQKDLTLSDMLAQALDMALTRNTGGANFTERRDYPPEIEAALDKLYALKHTPQRP